MQLSSLHKRVSDRYFCKDELCIDLSDFWYQDHLVVETSYLHMYQFKIGIKDRVLI